MSDAATSPTSNNASEQLSSSTSLADQTFSTTAATLGSEGPQSLPGSDTITTSSKDPHAVATATATASLSQGERDDPAAENDSNTDSTAMKAPTAEVETLNRVGHQIAQALELKEQGNALFASGDRLGAMSKWHHALLHSAGINSLASQYGSKSTEAQNKQGQAVTMAVYNNLASCYLADRKYEKVIYATGKVLALDESNVKALYRRAKAYKELGNEKRSAQDLDKAMAISPQDASLRALATELVTIEEAKLAKQKRQMSGFLKGKSLSSTEPMQEGLPGDGDAVNSRRAGGSERADGTEGHGEP